MTIIYIEKEANNAHNNQTIYSSTVGKFRVPDGWAVIPDDMETPNFPFGEVTVEIVNGVPTVTSWTPGTIPDPEPEPEPEPTAEDVTLDMLADHEERLCMLELTTTTV